jgi:hypothetical protein
MKPSYTHILLQADTWENLRFVVEALRGLDPLPIPTDLLEYQTASILQIIIGGATVLDLPFRR